MDTVNERDGLELEGGEENEGDEPKRNKREVSPDVAQPAGDERQETPPNTFACGSSSVPAAPAGNAPNVAEIEAVAAAMFKSRHLGGSWWYLDEKEHWRKLASVAISALRRADKSITHPVKPSEAAVDAVSLELKRIWAEHPSQCPVWIWPEWWSRFHNERILTVAYRAERGE